MRRRERLEPKDQRIYTIRSSDGGGLARITNAGGAAHIPIDYSPDGTQIVFGRVDPNDHSCTKRSALFVVNVDGSGLRRITPWGFCDNDGSWSPDGSTIAFVKPDGSIFVVHLDGTGLAKIPLDPKDSAGDVAWSPDGTKIVFILSTPTSPEGIATANADGADVQQVKTSPTFGHQPDWGSHPAT